MIYSIFYIYSALRASFGLSWEPTGPHACRLSPVFGWVLLGSGVVFHRLRHSLECSSGEHGETGREPLSPHSPPKTRRLSNATPDVLYQPFIYGVGFLKWLFMDIVNIDIMHWGHGPSTVSVLLFFILLTFYWFSSASLSSALIYLLSTTAASGEPCVCVWVCVLVCVCVCVCLRVRVCQCLCVTDCVTHEQC